MVEDAWEKRWNRPPTPEEQDGLIKEHIRQTVFYREAIVMGLDAIKTAILIGVSSRAGSKTEPTLNSTECVRALACDLLVFPRR